MTARSSLGNAARFVLQLGFLAGCVAIVIFALQPELSIEAVLLRAFIVFVAVAVLATLFLVLFRLGKNSQLPISDDTPGRNVHEKPSQTPTQS